ncbi:MAG: peptide-methionine (S)-S-oxide reductase MsrA [Candidatus Levybacteria bacterium]|nr:peptide-methionine (S)-S-oxide reductase MsrA [Candidatus Levybacteria bacterium]
MLVTQKTNNEIASFGGGCFWCTEAIFKRLKGVSSVLPGYSGGSIENPTYEQVCEGTTGHAEAIQIEFDPSEIAYEKLLEVFFYTHDPTTPNQQGNDVGEQYRSVVFYHSAKQNDIAQKFIKDLEQEKVFSRPIVTTIEPFKNFYIAEDYHKSYFEKNKDAPYCTYVITPKLKKLMEKFGEEVRDEYKIRLEN